MGLENLLVGVVAALFQAVSGALIIFKQVNKVSLINKIIYVFIMFIYGIVTFYFIPNELRFLSFILIVTIILKFILKINDKKIILYPLNTQIILVFSEILISFLLVLFGLDSVSIVNNPFYNLLAIFLISLLATIIIFIKPIRTLIKKELGLFERNRKLLKYTYILILLLYLISLKNGLEFLLEANYYINILFILSIVVVVIIVLEKGIKSEQLKEEYQQMLNYVSKYEKIITEQGKANHEFKNQLMVIRGYAQMNSTKLIEYIDSITEDTRKTQSSYMISQLNKFPDGGIKGLLYYKLATMVEENISYDLQVEPGVKIKLSKLSVVMYKNITKILGVLLDNAIDASKKSKLKKIIISVEKDNKNVIFTIQNSYKGKIELSKFGTGYTTKGNKHGYGLKLVKDIIDESKQFDIEKNYDKEYFYTRLIVKINNKKRKSK